MEWQEEPRLLKLEGAVAGVSVKEGDIRIDAAVHESGGGAIWMFVETEKGLVEFVREVVPQPDTPQFMLALLGGKISLPEDMDPATFAEMEPIERLKVIAEHMFSRLDRPALDAEVAKVLAEIPAAEAEKTA